MILFDLFFTFFKIGIVSFGGGYAMIPLVTDYVLSNSWATELEVLNMIAISESTPGPIAINMATYIGSSQAGVLGAFFATLGVVLPSFIIILLIAAVINSFMKYKSVEAFVGAVRPCAVALIIATAINLLIKTLFGFSTIESFSINFDFKAVIIFLVVALLAFLTKKIKKKKISPIILILISAFLGAILYSM